MGVVARVELCEIVVEVRRVFDGVTAVALVFEEDGQSLFCGYALQSGRRFEEKQSFYELNGEWDMHSAVFIYFYPHITCVYICVSFTKIYVKLINLNMLFRCFTRSFFI